MHSKALSFDKEVQEPKLMPLFLNEDASDRSKYGVSETDTFCLDIYLAMVIANSLRMLSAYSCAEQDYEGLESTAMKLEFYAQDMNPVIYDNIDWSMDTERDLTDPKWLGLDEQPGFQEFCKKTDVVEEVQEQFAREALTWLAENWTGLWH